MAQISQSVSKMENLGTLHPQTKKNQKNNVCAISLRNGRKFGGPNIVEEEEEEKEELVIKEEPKKDDKKEKNSGEKEIGRERSKDQTTTFSIKIEQQ